MRMGNGHFFARKIKGALFRDEKGKVHFFKLIGALVKVKGALFLRKRRALLTKLKGHFPM